MKTTKKPASKFARVTPPPTRTTRMEDNTFHHEVDSRIHFQRCGGGRRVIRKKIGGE